MTPTTAASSQVQHVVYKKKKTRRAALAGYIGGTLEYYDNYAYGIAATLVFAHIFFPQTNPVVATVASLSTFAISYIARPLGAVLLGHVGDKVGRKQALVLILILMGVSTFLIGLLPTYDTIGIWAPILLVTLRILQGISIGGETAAATALVMEVAPNNQRGFYTSWVTSGIVSGFVLATLVFIPISAMPQETLFSWGWRIPFLLSILVTIAGFIIRAKLSEPEAFVEAKQDDSLSKLPIIEVFRSNWQDLIRVLFCSLAFAIDTVIKVYALSLATDVFDIPYATMLTILVITHVLAIITQPLLGMLSDRVGRKPVFIAGNIGSAIFIFSYLASIASGNLILISLTAFLSVTCAFAAINASYPAFFAEMFSLQVRQTGMSLGIQLGLIVAGIAPAIYVAMTAADPTNWMPAATVASAIALIAASAALTTKETAKTELVELGGTPPR